MEIRKKGEILWVLESKKGRDTMEIRKKKVFGEILWILVKKNVRYYGK